jgi:hypothetical protein
MTENEIILYFILMVVTYFFFAKYLRQKAIMHEATKDVVAKHVHEIKSEQHGAIMYWFDKTSDQFYAQGKTMEDCIAHLKQVYPGHVFLYDTAGKQYLLVGPDFDPVLVDEGDTLSKKDFE